MENKNWKRVAFGNGRFVVIADSMGGCCSSSSSNAMHSVDGISWNEIASTQITHRICLVKTDFARDSKFVAVGNGIYYSNDGISRTASANQSGQYSAITYGNGQFAMDVNQNNSNEPVLSISTDGVQWEQDMNFLKDLNQVTVVDQVSV